MKTIDLFMIDQIRVLGDRIRTLTMTIGFYSKEENKARISPEELALMRKHLTIMKSYSLILKKRVALSCNKQFASDAELNKFADKLLADHSVVDITSIKVSELERIASDMALANKADRETLIVEALQLSQVASILQFDENLCRIASDRIREILLKL